MTVTKFQGANGKRFLNRVVQSCFSCVLPLLAACSAAELKPPMPLAASPVESPAPMPTPSAITEPVAATEIRTHVNITEASPSPALLSMPVPSASPQPSPSPTPLPVPTPSDYIVYVSSGGSSSGSVSTPTPTPMPITVTDVKIAAVAHPSIVRGTTLKLYAHADFSDRSTSSAVLWSSSNPAVATVDSQGQVTTLSAGSVDMVATSADDANQTAKLTLTVTNPVVHFNGTIAYIANNDVYVMKGSNEHPKYSSP